MKTIEEILETIDKSKMQSYCIDWYGMLESEFGITEWIEQVEGDEKLTYCYYHSWICTDTEVGIRVWYFEGNPVCISYKPYRKYSEIFGWISDKCYEVVRKYAVSLSDAVYSFTVIDDEAISNIITQYAGIDHKEHEQLNVLPR